MLVVTLVRVIARKQEGSRGASAGREDDAMDAAARTRTAVIVGAVIVVLAVLAWVARRDPPAPEARPSPPAVPSPVPSFVPRALDPPAALRSFAELGGPGPRRVPVAQDGVPLRVDALSPTGLLLGGAGFAADPYRAADRVGLVEPGQAGVRWLTDGATSTIYGRAAGDGVVAWAESDGAGILGVMCARAAEGWRPARISIGELNLTDRPVHVDGTTVAWSDAAGRAWAADDCGRPRVIGRGAVVGLAAPVAFLRPATGPVAVVPLADPDRSTTLPIGSERGIPFAVSRDSVVWVANEGLVRYERATGRTQLLDVTLPSATSSRSGAAVADLTVGNRLVSYASRSTDGDPSLTRSVLYDLTTGAWLLFNAEVFVAGDQIVWREAGHYAVTTTN